MSTTKRRPIEQQESVKEYFLRMRKEAIESSRLHVDVKPIKYDLK